MKKAVIFDMDGVVIDSQPDYFYTDRETLRVYGKDVDISFVSAYAGIANRERMEKYIVDLGMKCSVEDMLETNISIYKNLLDEKGMIPVKGIPELIKILFDKGILLAVASSSPYEIIYKVIRGFGLEQFFTVILSGEAMQKSKPDPEIFIKTAESLGVQPEECIVIEDSANGVLASNKAGIKCVAFKNPHSGNQDLTNADCIINEFNELINDFSWLG